jgi:hypothetical protein
MLVASSAVTWNVFSAEKMATQVQKPEKYNLFKVMEIVTAVHRGLWERLGRNRLQNGPLTFDTITLQTVAAVGAPAHGGGAQRWSTIHDSLHILHVYM